LIIAPFSFRISGGNFIRTGLTFVLNFLVDSRDDARVDQLDRLGSAVRYTAIIGFVYEVQPLRNRHKFVTHTMEVAQAVTSNSGE
jgi:hypothetical protein